MSRSLNFRQIEAFRAVMLTGTTTSAARMLHTTQPSVSRLIGQIQSATGITLFDMRHGRLRPTVEATELFDTIQRHFLGLESIEARVEAMRHSGSGMLRIACTPSLGLGVVPAAISAFSTQHPDVQINVQTLGSRYLRDGLQHGLFDLVLSTAAFGAASSDEERIHRSDAVCVVRPGHALANKKKVHVRDLRGMLLLSLNADDDLVIALGERMSEHGVAPSSKIETTYSSTICLMTARTDGVGIVNEYVAHVFAEKLAILPFFPRIPVDMYLAYPPQRAPSRLAKVFADVVRDQLRPR
ncbi:MAG: LysR substrate-binding domain-containing protein [Burkholderiaceae bacterium]